MKSNLNKKDTSFDQKQNTEEIDKFLKKVTYLDVVMHALIYDEKQYIFSETLFQKLRKEAIQEVEDLMLKMQSQIYSFSDIKDRFDKIKPKLMVLLRPYIAKSTGRMLFNYYKITQNFKNYDKEYMDKVLDEIIYLCGLRSANKDKNQLIEKQIKSGTGKIQINPARAFDAFWQEEYFRCPCREDKIENKINELNKYYNKLKKMKYFSTNTFAKILNTVKPKRNLQLDQNKNVVNCPN
jgi:hypothetical protein